MTTLTAIMASLALAAPTSASVDAADVDGVAITKAPDGRAAECKPTSSRLLPGDVAAVCQVLTQRYGEAVATEAKAKPARRIWSYSDYPKSAVRKGEQGASFIRWEVGVDGKVVRCAVERSSGSRALDQVSCQKIKELGSYDPARDNAGAPIPTFMTRRVDWSLP
jgi:TonB family protein